MWRGLLGGLGRDTYVKHEGHAGRDGAERVMGLQLAVHVQTGSQAAEAQMKPAAAVGHVCK